MQAGLYIVGTPIGNLGDISVRAVETLKNVNLILAEDTRHTRKLLTRYDIHTPLMSCHRFNEASRTAMIADRIGKEGAAVALVSNAGMPGISDPGNRMITACRSAGVKVEVVPGPSAVTAAAALSGFCEEGFLFLGFLPHKSGARKRLLAEQAGHSLPVILFESPYRILRVLEEIEEVLGGGKVFLARELTKQFEECMTGTAATLRTTLQARVLKGEWVVIIAPSPDPEQPRAVESVSATAIDTV